MFSSVLGIPRFSIFICILPGLLLTVVCRANAPTSRAITVEDAIESTRLMLDSDGRSIFLSPNSRRYAITLVRGDVARDGVWLEVFSGETTSLHAARPFPVAKLFTSGLGGNAVGEGDLSSLVSPGANVPKWLDDTRITLLWEDGFGVKQVICIDVVTRNITYLTDSKTDVVVFEISPDQHILYGARSATLIAAQKSSEEKVRNGFAVTSSSAYELALGLVDSSNILDLTQNFEWFVSNGTNGRTRKVAIDSSAVNRTASRVTPTFSSDGKAAIIDGSPESIPTTWHAYKDAHFIEMLKDLEIDQSGGYARQFRKLYVVDIEKATARSLSDVPATVWPTVSWSPDGQSVLISPTFLPVDMQDFAGLHGVATAEFAVATGRVWKLPTPPVPDGKSACAVLTWLSRDQAACVTNDGFESRYRKVNGKWKSDLSRGDLHARSFQRNLRKQPVRVNLEVRQDINKPPRVFAVEARTGREKMLLDSNHRLTNELRLGRVRNLRWKDSAGRDDAGRLYLPPSFKDGQLYPLAIQTHGLAEQQEFSLYGTDGRGYGSLGPGSPVHLGHLLAAHGIAVLQLDDIRTPRGEHEPHFNMRRYEAAALFLVSLGIVDGRRVAITGHSRTGWYVEYTLAHSDYPFAAAIASDNMDGSYFQAALSGWSATAESTASGIDAFGIGLGQWLSSAAAFNAERVRIPLQLQVTSSFAGLCEPVFLHWELFSRLKYLKRPVELYVAPSLLRGAHVPQNPRQVMAIQTRSLDWLLYWLKDEENEPIRKAEQYEAWRRLRILRDANSQTPRAPKLHWIATPEGAPLNTQ